MIPGTVRPRLSDLTATQRGAVAEMLARGYAVEAGIAFGGPGGTRSYTYRTLQAVVDTGAARWTVIHSPESSPTTWVRVGIRPVACTSRRDGFTCTELRGHASPTHRAGTGHKIVAEWDRTGPSRTPAEVSA